MAGAGPRPRIPVDAKPVCCLVHVFYPEIWPELAAHIKHLGDAPFEIHVNVVNHVATENFIATIRGDFPDATIRVSPNRGRDIGGFFALLEGVDFSRHDLFCLLHTKRSPHMIGFGGRNWRRSLLKAILGSERQAAINIDAMLKDPGIGVIGAKKHRSQRIFANRELYDRFLDQLGIEGAARDCEFVAGTMMLVRSGILETMFRAFRDLDFEPGDDLSLKGHLDGQIAHAMERIIGSIVRAKGLRFHWR